MVHLSQIDQAGWVIRDYVANQMLRRSSPPNPSFTNLSLDEVEAVVKDSELPPYFNKENVSEWTTYLRLRSMAALRSSDADLRRPPSTDAGDWQPIPPNGG